MTSSDWMIDYIENSLKLFSLIVVQELVTLSRTKLMSLKCVLLSRNTEYSNKHVSLHIGILCKYLKILIKDLMSEKWPINSLVTAILPNTNIATKC